MTDDLNALAERCSGLDPEYETNWGETTEEIAALRAVSRCDACDTDEHGRVPEAQIASVVHLLARLRLVGFPAPIAVYDHCGTPFAEWHFKGVRVIADFWSRHDGIAKVMFFRTKDGTSDWYTIPC